MHEFIVTACTVYQGSKIYYYCGSMKHNVANSKKHCLRIQSATIWIVCKEELLYKNIMLHVWN